MNRGIVATLVLAGFSLGILVSHFWERTDSDTPSTAEAPKSERRVLYWHDPMVPGPRFDKPGKSPFMDMDLVPVYEDEAGAAAAGGAPIVTVRPEIVNNIGVRTYIVKRMPLSHRTVTHGYLIRANHDGALIAEVDIFDRDADWVRAGMPARLKVDALPGEVFAASVAHIDPDIGIGARTLKARIRIARRDPRLKANMFAEVVIEAPHPSVHLAIPREALIRTGTRTAVVLVRGPGQFQPVDVVAGRELGDFIEIRSGLKEQDAVVVSGQFLIDSEASLRATFTRLTPAESDKKPDAPAPAPAPAPAVEHKH